MDKKVKILKALAHPLRIEIVTLLSTSGELCVCVLQNTFDVKQSNLSQHLKILKEADILESRKDAAWIYYKLKNQKIVPFMNQLNDLE